MAEVAENVLAESCQTVDVSQVSSQRAKELLNNQIQYCIQRGAPRSKNKTFNLNGRQNLALHRFCQYSDNKGILLMHSVGSGKTLTSLSMALSCFNWEQERMGPNDARKIIIVAPTGLYKNFIDDLDKNIPSCVSVPQNLNNPLGDRIRIKIGPNVNDTREVTLYSLKYSEIVQNYLTNDLQIKKLNDKFRNAVVIFDEAHRLFRMIPTSNQSILDVMIKNNSLNDS
jgi:N12 class adenine-specific DNA methylase